MKYKTIGTVILVLLLGVMIVSSVPEEPHRFYGTVTIGGTSAPVGSVITAKIGGTTKGSITTTVAGNYGGASADQAKLVVTKCQTDESCYAATQTISFTISASGCSGTDTLTTNIVPGSIEQRALAFGGSCGASSGAGSTGGGGGGGGGGSGDGGGPSAKSQEYSLPSSGGQITIRLYDMITIVIDGEKHTFTLDEITREYIIGTWNSLPKTIQVPLHQTVLTDFEDDGANDVSTTLDDVAGTLKQATLTIVSIQKEKKAEEPVTQNQQPEEQPPVPPKKQPLVGWIIIGGIVLVGLIGYYIYYKKTSEEY